MTTLKSALRAWPTLLPVLFLVPCVLAAVLNHDVVTVLAFSQRWLAGERPYVDLIDVNPPLIFMLNLLPAGLARLTGTDAVTAPQACLLAWGEPCGCWGTACSPRRQTTPRYILAASIPARVIGSWNQGWQRPEPAWLRLGGN